MKKRSLALITAVILAVAAFTGCGKKEEKTSTGARELTVWGLASSANAQESPFIKGWEEGTGVKLNFMQTMEGSSEPFNLMIASGEYPDIIFENLYASGGINKYAEDGVIIEITDMLEEKAPNYKKFLDENPELDKSVKTDDGKYYGFSSFSPDERLRATCGPMVRKDLLDKAGMEIPETIADWEEVLRYFKSLGMSKPLSYNLLSYESNYGGFIGAYGVKANFYIKDGKVKWGYLEPEMLEALKNLNKWYEEGLIDKEIVKVTSLDTNILNSDTGATLAYLGSGMGKWLDAMKAKDSNFNIVAAPYPVLKKGDKPVHTSTVEGMSPRRNGFISTACKDVDLAMEFLDWGYSEEGHMFFNFGIEGESYNMVDGYPTFTDIILKDAKGRSISDMMEQYVRSHSGGPFATDIRVYEQYYPYQQQLNALEVWPDMSTVKNHLPLTLTLTAEESSKVSTITNNLNTYCDEQLFRYIMGLESLDTYDEFIKKQKDLGIDEALKVYQTAYERYLKR